MDIDLYRPHALPEKLAHHGRLYIVKRFKDEWSIDRSEDITVAAMLARTNLVAFEGSKIVGWLGVTTEGELVNGCAGPGRSGSILSSLLKRLFAEDPQANYYAYVPIDYLASGYLCIQAGMELSSVNHPEFLRKAYGEQIISLVKLVSSPFPSTDPVANRRICRERINNLHHAINSKVRAGPWLRLTRRLKKFGQDIGSDKVSPVMQAILCLGSSFVYYLAMLSLLGHNIPQYFDFLSKRKSVIDRQELRQYLEVSTSALNNIEEQIRKNDEVINDFVGLAKSHLSERMAALSDPFLSLNQDNISKKQKDSIHYMSEILEGFRADMDNGRESSGRATAQYIAVLQFMSEDYPYRKLAGLLPRNSDPCLKNYVNRPVSNASAHINIKSASSLCPIKALEKYISVNNTRSPWGLLLETFPQ